jgi:DNA-binding transcriptional ArsR family regulator
MERRPATAEEAQALANPLRIRILRLTLDRALTNKEIAARLGRDPGTILHHVRKLVATGFLASEGERRGTRGAVERPYRATGKSWRLDIGNRPGTHLAMVDAFRDEWSELEATDVRMSARLGVRLRPEVRDEFDHRFTALVQELAESDDPEGEPMGFFIALHRRRDDDPPARAATAVSRTLVQRTKSGRAGPRR